MLQKTAKQSICTGDAKGVGIAFLFVKQLQQRNDQILKGKQKMMVKGKT